MRAERERACKEHHLLTVHSRSSAGPLSCFIHVITGLKQRKLSKGTTERFARASILCMKLSSGSDRRLLASTYSTDQVSQSSGQSSSDLLSTRTSRRSTGTLKFSSTTSYWTSTSRPQSCTSHTRIQPACFSSPFPLSQAQQAFLWQPGYQQSFPQKARGSFSPS